MYKRGRSLHQFGEFGLGCIEADFSDFKMFEKRGLRFFAKTRSFGSKYYSEKTYFGIISYFYSSWIPYFDPRKIVYQYDHVRSYTAIKDI